MTLRSICLDRIAPSGALDGRCHPKERIDRGTAALGQAVVGESDPPPRSGMTTIDTDDQLGPEAALESTSISFSLVGMRDDLWFAYRSLLRRQDTSPVDANVIHPDAGA